MNSEQKGRQRLLQKIKAYRLQQSISQQDFQRMVAHFFGGRSLKKLRNNQLKKFHDHLILSGGQLPSSPPARAKNEPSPYRMETNPQLRIIKGILMERGLSWAYVRGVGRRKFPDAHLEELTSFQLADVVEALEKVRNGKRYSQKK